MNARGFWRLPGALLAGALLVSCASAPQSGPGNTGARTLAQAEVDGLLLGRGMGMAAVAEINGYPGPQHVLDLKEELNLTPDQRFATSRLVGLVQGRVRALGQRVVDAERRLDADMAAGNLSADQVRSRLETIAAFRAQLRYTHIHAHIEQQKILTPEQVRQYYELRGRDVIVAARAMPPAPTEPLTLPAATTTTPAPIAAPTRTPAVIPVPTPPVAPVVAPIAEPEPEMPAEVVAEPEAQPLPEAAKPLTPGMLDALPDAQPVEAVPAQPPVTSPTQPKAQAVEPQPARAPAYPLTPIGEEPPPPPPLLPEEEAPAMTPGMRDAMEFSEPAPAPDARSPGMLDAMEFAEPLPAEEAEAEPEIHIAPLEDDELQELEPVDSEEPASVDLDN